MAREIGILTASGAVGRLGGNRANFARLCRVAQRAGMECSVFNIDPGGQVSCHRWRSGDRAFRRVERELPGTLYNRIPLRSWEGRGATAGLLAAWTAQGRIVTNPRFLQKAEVGRLWNASDALRSFVPVQEEWIDPEQIAAFVLRHRSVYVKPLAGKAGIGIVRVRHSGGRYEAVLQQAGATRVWTGLSAYALQRLLWRADRYLLQEDADCALVDGRKFDLRLLFHRVPGGAFSLTGTGVRVGPPGGITTHVPNGGSLARPSDVLPVVFGAHTARVDALAKQVAQQAVDAVTGLPGVWCELSLDMGLSRAGEPRLFEANAKPMKFDEPDIERLAKRRLVEFLGAL